MRKQNPAFECFICDSCGQGFDVPVCRAHSEIGLINTGADSVKMYDICPACSSTMQKVLDAPKPAQPPTAAQPEQIETNDPRQ